MNTLKTTLLMAALTGLFIGIGKLLGGTSGMMIAFGIAVLMNVGSYWFSDKIVLRLYGAREVSPAEAPRLFHLTRRLTERAGLPMPRLYVLPQPILNAFATGRNAQHAAVAVTEGLLGALNDDELEGVLAHELAHVRNRDILLSTVVATLAGAVTMVADMARWAALFGGFGGSRDDEEEGGGGLIGSLVLMIVAPIAALLIQFAISRSREYLADATGARIAGTPFGLSNALRKLEVAAQAAPVEANPSTAHLFIVNPLRGGGILSLFSTHPATEARIARLEALAGRVEIATR
jgi:heat shock protein HtpX